MNATQENKVSRNFKIRTFFNNHLATFSPNVPYLSTAVTNFNNKLDEIQQYDMQATENTTGYTLQKAAYRTQMRDATLKVCGGLKALAITTNNIANVEKASLTKSSLDNARDTDALYACERILLDAQNTGAAALTPYGVNDAMIISLEALATQFKLYIQTPKDEKFESVSAGAMVDKCLAECDDILILIDALMLTQQDSYPQLYIQYLGDKSIDDDSGSSSPTPPDYVVLLQPNVFTEILTLPYNAAQRFKAKNTGAADVNWSLSINNTSFSNPPKALAAGAESILLSSTFGGSGDVLVFLNPSPTPVTVEVTVVDL